jgi:hypothetical protein
MVAISGLLLAVGVAAAAPAAASSQAHGSTAIARTVPRARAESAGGPGRSGSVYDPKAYAAAVKSGDWVYTPEGLQYKTCVYSAPAGATVDKGVIIYRNGARLRMKLCTHPTLAYPGTNTPRRTAAPAATPGGTTWWASAWYFAPTWENYLWERFSVPSDPQRSGALIFYFPSLEDPDGTTILQPVLTWGANPGIVSNPSIWYITSWYVWNNNHNSVHSTNSVHVGPGDTIDGSIAASTCNANGTCTWTVETCVEGGNCASPLTVTSGVPFTSAQAGVMEVSNNLSSCYETPENGHEAFRSLSLATHDGSVTPTFGIQYPGTQYCGVTETASHTGADILWTP